MQKQHVDGEAGDEAVFLGGGEIFPELGVLVQQALQALGAGGASDPIGDGQAQGRAHGVDGQGRRKREDQRHNHHQRVVYHHAGDALHRKQGQDHRHRQTGPVVHQLGNGVQVQHACQQQDAEACRAQQHQQDGQIVPQGLFHGWHSLLG